MLSTSRADSQRFEALLGTNVDDDLLALPAPQADTGGPVPNLSSLDLLFLQAGIDSKNAKRKTIVQLLFLVGLIICASGVLAIKEILLLVPIVVALQYFMLSKQASRRAHAFEKDYTALLLALSSSVKTGLDPLVALQRCAELFAEDSEVARELLKLGESIERGATESEVMRAFAESIAHPDLDLFRCAFILARREGSSLANCLRRLARVTRQRQSFRRKIRSAVALQKLSALGIAACTVVIGLIQYSTNPVAFQQTLAHPVGSKILMAGIALVVGGVLWMFKLAKSRI